MRNSPDILDVPRYPVIAATALLATGATIALWKQVDVSPLLQSVMIRRGELWRLATSIFPHFNFFLLLFNLYWLWAFGAVLEERLGHFKTAALILLFAFGSGALQFGFSVNGAGLSGVIYGLFGLLCVLSRMDERFRDAIGRNTVLFFAAWFLLCAVIALTTVPQLGNMNNVAHGAGLVLGILTAFAITVPGGRIPVTIAIAALLLFALWSATLGRPMVHRTGAAGYEEGRWGHDALQAHRNQEAARWLRDAVAYQPGNGGYWHELAIADEHLRDWRAAFTDHRQAANLGNAESQFFMGVVYANGFGGMPKDDVRAVFWYRKAADQGNADAQNYLGSMYEQGRGLPQDETQAFYWYRKSADQGNAGGENDLAWLCATSSNPAIRNPAIALEYAHRAVNSVKDHPNPNFLDTLAEAHYINGQYADAVKMEQQALALMSGISPPPPHLSEFQQRLAKYQQALQRGRHGTGRAANHGQQF